MSEKNRKALRWLYEQLPGWVEADFLSAEQAERLKTHYGPLPDREYPQLGTIVIGVLGTLLIGGGILLLVGYNWDNLSRFWRTVLSFAPLVLAQGIYAYVFFKKSKYTAWVEGASTFLFLMIGATLALISQTYNIAGTMGDYLLTWALLSIPTMYLLNASLPAVLYLIGIAWWVVFREGNEGVYYWGLLAAAVPHLRINLRPDRSPIRRRVLGWALVLPFFVAWWWVVEPEIYAFGFIGTSLVLANLFLLGPLVYPEEHRILTQPFRTAAIIGVYIFLLVLTFRFDLEANTLDMLFNGKNLAPWAARINLAVLILLFAAFFYLFLSRFSRHGAIAHSVWLFPFLVLIYLLLHAGKGVTQAMVLANLYTLFFGVAFLLTGLNRQRLWQVNTGMLFILLLAAVRFFDTDWSYLVKGIAFVLLGVAFLSANMVFSRKLARG